jgi:hypothetical protein
MWASVEQKTAVFSSMFESSASTSSESDDVNESGLRDESEV